MNDLNQADRAKRDAAFATHRREQLDFAAALPLWDKLRWLEEMHHIALHLQRSRASQREGQDRGHE